MPKAVRVTPEDVLASAATVEAHADTMWAAHGTADGRIEAAQQGVPGRAVVALTAAVAKWQADSSGLFARMIEHAEGLRGGAVAYAQTDEHGAAAIGAAGGQTTALDLGL